MITIRSIRSAVVRRSDEFSFTEEPPMVRHRPRMTAEDVASEIVGAYAIATLSDDSTRVWHFDTRSLDASTKLTWEQRRSTFNIGHLREETYKNQVRSYAFLTLAKEGIFRS